MVRLHGRILQLHVAAGSAAHRHGGRIAEVTSKDRREIRGRRGAEPVLGLGPVFGIEAQKRVGLAHAQPLGLSGGGFLLAGAGGETETGEEG